MSDPWREARPTGRVARRTLALALVCGAAACTSSPRYPISMDGRAGDGSVMAWQPRYAVSAQDAAQNAADCASQAGYPAYNAPPVAEPTAPPPAASVAAEPPAPQDSDMSDDAPRGLKSAPVDSADLPPPGAAPPAASPSTGTPAQSDDVPPPDPAATPHEIGYDFGGGRIVFGTDAVETPEPLLAAYRHHRRRHAGGSASADDTGASQASDSAASDAKGTASAAADTPYQTTVKPGETLAQVAERVHSSKAALAELNGLKHPRHVKAGTVLKIPYRYTYEVQKGDTLYTISHRFDQDPSALAKLNGLKAVPTLQPGQTLQLPPEADDQGKRDHASAAGPSPEAAPEKLQTAALKKAERKSRRARAAEAAEASARANRLESELAASAPATPRHRRGAETAAAETATAASPSAGGVQTAAGAPATPAVSTYRAPTTAAPATSPAVSNAVAAAATGAPVATSPTARTPSTAVNRAATSSLYAAAGQQTPTAASPAAGSSTYAANGYVARTPPATGSTTLAAPSTVTRTPLYAPSTPRPAAASQYASASTPRYVPNYPATGGAAGATTPYALSLGRERPAAPALSGGALTAADIASAGRGRFIWPLRGPVISGFGAKGTGEYNNGLDISAAPGTSVRAAASGDVVYAGSSIPGYGNMVLIKHPGGWVTAYAHLNRIEVRMHDTVSQGDEIGQAGQTGVVDRPELYFEVRYGATAVDRPRPVDPTLVLPAGS